jgi:hypothetical protein
MKKKVVHIENIVSKHARGTKGSNYLTLECGHIKRQKGSIKTPKTCKCDFCK